MGPAAGLNVGVVPLVEKLEALINEHAPPVELVRHPRVRLFVCSYSILCMTDTAPAQKMLKLQTISLRTFFLVLSWAPSVKGKGGRGIPLPIIREKRAHIQEAVKYFPRPQEGIQ